MEPGVTNQQSPRLSTGDVWLLVIRDMESRRQFGIQKYGVPVQPHNGRDALLDAYQEALDLCVYLRQAIEERDAYQEALDLCVYLRQTIEERQVDGRVNQGS